MAAPTPTRLRRNKATQSPTLSAAPSTSSTTANGRRWAWFAVEGNIPLRLFDGPLATALRAPERATLQQELSDMLHRAMVSQAMQEAGEVALVVDAWTSASGGHYVSIMAHWCDADNHMRHALLRTVEFKRKDQTPEALAQALAACVDSYAIGKCVWAIVSNDRCNMMSVCAQLRTMLGSPIEHFHCAAHSLHRMVTALLEHDEVAPLLARLKTLIKHYTSTVGARALAEVQTRHQLRLLDVFKPATTRLSNRIDAYKRLLDVKLAITFVSESESNEVHPTLQAPQWIQFESLVSLLLAISFAIDLVQSDTCPSMGLLPGLVLALSQLLSLKQRPGMDGACAAALRVLQECEPHLCTPAAVAAHILDINVPCRVASQEFLTHLRAVQPAPPFGADERRSDGLVRPSSFVASASSASSQQPSEIDSPPVGTRRPASPSRLDDEPAPKRPMLRAECDFLVQWFSGHASDATQPPQQASLEREVAQFIALRSTPSSHESALQWWRETPAELPLLKALARRVLALPCSAASMERVWSQARCIIVEDRSSLDWVALDTLLFLRCNRKLLLANDTIGPSNWWENLE